MIDITALGTTFRMLQFAVGPPYTLSIIHTRTLQLTIQELSATGLLSAYKSLATSERYLAIALQLSQLCLDVRITFPRLLEPQGTQKTELVPVSYN